MNQVRTWLWPQIPEASSVTARERRQIELARQFSTSADVLWYAGHRSAAIYHAERALVYATSAEVVHEEPEKETDNYSSEATSVPVWVDTALRQVSTKEKQDLLAAAKRLDGERVPPLDRDVPAGAGLYYRALVGMTESKLREQLPRLHTRFGVWLRRIRTIGILLLFAAAGVYYLTRPDAPAEARASAAFSATYPASAVIDGKYDAVTHEWILPHSRRVGWVEVELGEVEKIENVKIKNASHPPHHTYGTKAFRLEVFKGGALVHKEEGSFGSPNVKSPWWSSKKIGKEADRIRVYVLSSYGPAGGLAEITWH